jgi:hypothetical protein
LGRGYNGEQGEESSEHEFPHVTKINNVSSG